MLCMNYIFHINRNQQNNWLQVLTSNSKVWHAASQQPKHYCISLKRLKNEQTLCSGRHNDCYNSGKTVIQRMTVSASAFTRPKWVTQCTTLQRSPNVGLKTFSLCTTLMHLLDIHYKNTWKVSILAFSVCNTNPQHHTKGDFPMPVRDRSSSLDIATALPQEDFLGTPKRSTWQKGRKENTPILCYTECTTTWEQNSLVGLTTSTTGSNRYHY